MERVYRRVTTPDALPAPAAGSKGLDRHLEAIRDHLPRAVAYLQVLPLAIVFLVFFAVPIALVVAVSFFGYETYRLLIPAFTLENYREVFSTAVTYRTYLITIEFCAVTWTITLTLGFLIAYFLVFLVRSRTWQMVLSAAVHDPVLDFDRNSDDRVDTASRPPWADQSPAARARGCSRATGMAALLGVRRDPRLCPSLYADDDRADL